MARLFRRWYNTRFHEFDFSDFNMFQLPLSLHRTSVLFDWHELVLRSCFTVCIASPPKDIAWRTGDILCWSAWECTKPWTRIFVGVAGASMREKISACAHSFWFKLDQDGYDLHSYLRRKDTLPTSAFGCNCDISASMAGPVLKLPNEAVRQTRHQGLSGGRKLFLLALFQSLLYTVLFLSYHIISYPQVRIHHTPSPSPCTLAICILCVQCDSSFHFQNQPEESKFVLCCSGDNVHV